MKKSLLFYSCVFISAFYSCDRFIQDEKGGIDVISNIYFDASKNLDKMQTIHISKINYNKNEMIEIVPNVEFSEINQEMFYIKDTLTYRINTIDYNKTIFEDLSKTQNPIKIYNKKTGAVFSKEKILNYHYRVPLNDTILFNKKYKRFQINTPKMYSRYYIYQTDTLLPYSLYKHIEKEYKGRLERIDTYNKEKDIFVTIQLMTRKKWDEEAKEMFEYNQFLNNKNNE